MCPILGTFSVQYKTINKTITQNTLSQQAHYIREITDDIVSK